MISTFPVTASGRSESTQAATARLSGQARAPRSQLSRMRRLQRIRGQRSAYVPNRGPPSRIPRSSAPSLASPAISSPAQPKGSPWPALCTLRSNLGLGDARLPQGLGQTGVCTLSPRNTQRLCATVIAKTITSAPPIRLAPSSFSRSIPMLNHARNHSHSLPNREGFPHIWCLACPIRDSPLVIFPACAFLHDDRPNPSHSNRYDTLHLGCHACRGMSSGATHPTIRSLHVRERSATPPPPAPRTPRMGDRRNGKIESFKGKTLADEAFH
jgi:hypothetical protein